MSTRYDAIIIGAGHNGLVAAAYLARAGRRVLALERREIVGGACVTEEVWPGYRVSAAAYLCSLLHPRIVADLELPRYGFEVYRRETGGFAPFPDGSYLLIYPDAERTARELERFLGSRAETDAYFAFDAEIERAADILEPFFFGPSPTLDQLADAYAQAGERMLFEEFFTLSVRELLERRFSDPRLMAVLATDGLIGTCAGVETPGTAYVLLHHYMGRVLGTRGLWGFVRGGMGRITQALAESAREHGAQILPGSEVTRILTRGDRAVGVALANGDTYEAEAILSNAHPAVTFQLLDSPLPEPLCDTLSGWRSEGVSCKINLGVTQLPDFTCLRAAGIPPEIGMLGTVHICPSLDYLEQAWQDARQGRPSVSPMIEIYTQTITDRSLAPEGRHILSCFTQYFPYTLQAGLDYETEAQRYADRILDILAQYAPNIRASVERRQILTPQHLERQFALVGGHIFHGEITPDQMFGGRCGMRGPQTLIPGLYLCGSGAFPGGCVSGFPGWNAAQALLRPVA
jgi:phytoene dehydrogenase-like protein